VRSGNTGRTFSFDALFHLKPFFISFLLNLPFISIKNLQNMNEITLNQAYWDHRYQQQDTAWDLRQVSPPLKNYINQLKNKDLRILIPGCGNAYEAEYLYEQGFTNVTLIDIAPTLVADLKQRFEQTSAIKVVLGDFFEHQGAYDLILEQTFFCALDPFLRPKYVQKMHNLLITNGKLVGLLFDVMFENNPPHGGSKESYLPLFKDAFKIQTLERCTNSFIKRQGTELFMILKKIA
jgi:methyl halide transferase